jgi:predicted ATPase/class 3 adenylate cyclase
MPAPDLRSRLLAILAADVAGYSRLMSLDEHATVAALDLGRAVFQEQIVAHGGRVIDMAGDSVLSVFDTATGAVSAALSVQRQLAASAIDVPDDRRLRFRIGIHVGDVIEKADGTVYGDGVNIAARLEGLAVPGAIAVSQAVHSMVAQRVDAEFEDIGDQMVKNIAQPVRAFQARQRLPGEAPRSPAVGSSHPRRGNLPAVLPSLIGRADDVASLVALVSARRVVSIVGAGGIGKTRLALATAHALRDEFAHGAWMVELAPVADPALLPAAVAQALGATLSGNRNAQDEVIDALRDRAVLLVLDNCEHLLDAASAFSQALIERAAKAHLLITSQELLKIADEHLYRVATLSLPGTPDLAAAQASGAVALLVDRVQALQPTFALTELNVTDVVDICRRLDGLPLAIELAAARVPLLGAAGVRERLHERFRMLTGGARTALRRHQTLREALDWSHSLLGAKERAVFRRAGVFAGSFSMTAAQQVLGDPQLDAWAVLEHLGALVDKSLVVAEPVEPPRYRLLESARGYALEKLREAGETDPTLRRHAQAVLALFEIEDKTRWTTPLRVRVRRWMPDIDNLRAALDWASQSSEDGELHIRLASASGEFLVQSGHRVEGQRHCQQALERVDVTTPPAVEARILVSWSAVSHPKAGPAQLAASERAIALYRQIGDQRRLYGSLGQYAIAAVLGGHLASSERALREMERLHDSGWPPVSRCNLLLARSRFLDNVRPDQPDEMRDVALEMLRIARAANDEWWIEAALQMLARISRAQGNVDEAISRGRELVARHRQDHRDVPGFGFALSDLSSALSERGKLEEALTIAREAASVFARQGLLWIFLTRIAMLALARGHATEAALAFGRAEAAQAWRDAAPPPRKMRERDDLLRQLQEALSGPELERLLAEGAALTDEEAARIALAA